MDPAACMHFQRKLSVFRLGSMELYERVPFWRASKTVEMRVLILRLDVLPFGDSFKFLLFDVYWSLAPAFFLV